MERRNRSLEALNNLKYIDTLKSEEKAQSLLAWVDKYITHTNIEEFDLEMEDFKVLSELFYRNIIFIKQHRQEIKEQLDNFKKIKEFLLSS
jgi:hypothetical protein